MGDVALEAAADLAWGPSSTVRRAMWVRRQLHIRAIAIHAIAIIQISPQLLDMPARG